MAWEWAEQEVVMERWSLAAWRKGKYLLGEEEEEGMWYIRPS